MFCRFLLVGLLSLTTVGAMAQSDTKPPNVLLICIDDLKPTIGCYGDPVAVTPNIDDLAARGVRFDRAYCNQAVCAPSRNALMTGLRPPTIGVYDLPTHFRDAAPDVVTFSQHFKRNGYLAEGLGKIYHTGHGNRDDVDSWSTRSWRPKASAYVLEKNLAMRKPDAKGKVRGPATESAEVPDDTYADGLIAEEAVRRLETYTKRTDQPFFLAVGFLKPHLPFVAPKRYWDLYDESKLPMPTVNTAPRDAPSYAGTSFGELRNYSDMPATGEINEATTRHLIHGYYAATSYTDAQIGKLLGALDRLQLADKTIVALWGDHGWHLGDHGMWCKHTNYEQAARIPIIVAAPQGGRGVASEALIETVDLYPTVTELAGLPMPVGLDGQSFAGVVADPNTPARNFVTHVYPRGGRLGRAIRTERYRMVEWKKPGDARDTAEIELYDYQTDPLETKNLAASAAETVAMLRANLDAQPEAKPQWRRAKK
ncbi:sulfatase [Stieleria maiorica]|nr:sulfatase [Stieleria maiorica]